MHPPKVGTFLACIDRAAVNTPTGSQQRVIQSLRYLIPRLKMANTQLYNYTTNFLWEAEAAKLQVLKRTKGL